MEWIKTDQNVNLMINTEGLQCVVDIIIIIMIMIMLMIMIMITIMIIMCLYSAIYIRMISSALQ